MCAACEDAHDFEKFSTVLDTRLKSGILGSNKPKEGLSIGFHRHVNVRFGSRADIQNIMTIAILNVRTN